MNFEQARFNMVEQQIRPWEVLDGRVLELLETIQREDFVPVRYRKLAFADIAVPLECGQAMMRPKIEARLLQALVAANCVGGSYMQADRRAVLISRNPINGRSEEILVEAGRPHGVVNLVAGRAGSGMPSAQ